MSAACMYERRLAGRNWKSPAGVGLGKASKQTWVDAVEFHLREGDLEPADVAVALVLASYSDATLKSVWPSQETLGAAVRRCDRTVRRSLARLSHAGLIDWCHRFLEPRDGRPRATTNLYSFTLSASYREVARRRQQYRTAKRRPVMSDRSDVEQLSSSPSLPSPVAAVVQSAQATFDEAVSTARSAMPDVSTGDLVELVAAAWKFYRGSAPPPAEVELCRLE